MRQIKVKSVSDYLTKIQKYDLTHSICRGESTYHDSINSGIFRYKYPLKTSWITRQYYNLVGNTLSDLQKKHFIAFSQHYGIPTNLIDFTTSPLVALYFACQNAEKSETGYVYFIKDNKIIDISDRIDYINEKNYFENAISFSENNFDLTIDLVRKITNICLYYYNESTEVLENVIAQYQALAISTQIEMENGDFYPGIDYRDICFEANYKTILQQVLAQPERIIGEKEQEFINKVYSYFDQTFESDIVERVLSFLLTIKTVHTGLDTTTKWGIRDLLLPFYFTYTPPQIVSRIEHQSSVFVQQQYLDFYPNSSECLFDCVLQKITPDRTFAVQEKATILKELDRLGINEKSIFNDYDSIAKYVKRKVFSSE